MHNVSWLLSIVLDMETNLRFLDVADEPIQTLFPVEGYQELPLMPLEMAVEQILHLFKNLPAKVWAAKDRCKNPLNSLTQDESAAIHLYTVELHPTERSLYFQLNQILRSEDRRKLKPWFGYLKLFLTALFKLPSIKSTVWRGVKANLSHKYPKGSKCIWWGISSCTDSIGVLEQEQFLGQTGTRTLFSIECHSGKDIKSHSYYQTENEILLLPGTYLQVIDQLKAGSDGLFIIHMKEISPPHAFLEPPSTEYEGIPSVNSLYLHEKPETPEKGKNSSLFKIRDDRFDKLPVIYCIGNLSSLY
ncbi:unnamed protein product [Didymodactylos carnosus]|uniref:NAD(P)(+)--arginine ADP-ribosyltransferase n=1 Tax=Didymodactylos carnosus TaxID=1234261 RepID=A0A814QYV1_9BILA|nr:unnamed protein product [Didymodactylos carnosus]CAF1167860.1 unnamed protein product [Didymodactylos carnosus]CAF3889159.1 unnamed protein product [Didymodactylos carnosus]CAF3979386.1 unnamed protein product [Didymodactylos carnosus]